MTHARYDSSSLWLLRVSLIAVTLPVLLASLVQEAVTRPQASNSVEPDKADAAVFDGISFSAMYGTADFGSEEIKSPRGGSKAAIHALNRIEIDAASLGSSNVFLVRADDLPGAIEATRAVVAGGRSTDAAVASRESDRADSFWIVVYFGISNSGPSPWKLESVKRTDTGFRICFSNRKRSSGAQDSRQYILWAPVGKLDGAEYQLELFDKDRDRPVLARWVVIADD